MNCFEFTCNLCVIMCNFYVIYSLNPDSASLLLITMRKASPYGLFQIQTVQVHGEFPGFVEHTYAMEHTFFWLCTRLHNCSSQIWSVNPFTVQYKLLTLWTLLERFASCGANALGCWKVNFYCCNTILSIQRFEGHRILNSGRIQENTGLHRNAISAPFHTNFRLSSLYLLLFKATSK